MVKTNTPSKLQPYLVIQYGNWVILASKFFNYFQKDLPASFLRFTFVYYFLDFVTDAFYGWIIIKSATFNQWKVAHFSSKRYSWSPLSYSQDQNISYN